MAKILKEFSVNRERGQERKCFFLVVGCQGASAGWFRQRFKPVLGRVRDDRKEISEPFGEDFGRVEVGGPYYFY